MSVFISLAMVAGDLAEMSRYLFVMPCFVAKTLGCGEAMKNL